MNDTKRLSVPQLPRGLFSRLHRHGYVPIPNADKRCFLKGWNHLVVDERQAALWDRQRRWPAIGLRVEPPLLVADCDVADEGLMAALRRLLADVSPALLRGLERTGNPPKTAFFARYGGEDGPFFKRQTRLWTFNPNLKDAPRFRVEIFGGGGGGHQFGILGPHSHDAEGNVLKSYAWPGNSPVGVPIEDLPALTREETYAICDAAENLFRSTPGLEPVRHSRFGDGHTLKAYDLTEETVFTGPRGERLDLAGLTAAAAFAKARGEQMRVTGSFTDDQASAGSLRGLVGLDRNGLVFVHDTKTGITHRLVGTAPAPSGFDQDDELGDIIRTLRGKP